MREGRGILLLLLPLTTPIMYRRADFAERTSSDRRAFINIPAYPLCRARASQKSAFGVVENQLPPGDEMSGGAGRLRRWFGDGLLRQFVRDSSWMVASQLGTSLLGVVQVGIVSRALGPQQYGVLALIIGACTFVRQLASVRVWEFVTTDFAAAFAAKDAEKANLAFRTGLFISLAVNCVALVLVLLPASWIVHKFMHDGAAPWLLRAYAVGMAANWAYDTCFAVLRVAGRFRYLALQGLAMTAIRCLVLVAVAYSTPTLAAIVISNVAMEFAAATWIQLKASRVIDEEVGRTSHRWDFKLIITFLKARRNLLAIGSLVDTLRLVTARIDVLLLGWFRTPADVAVYQAAFTVVDGVNRLTNPIAMVVFSSLSRLAADKDHTRFLRFIRRVAGLAFLLAMTVAIGILVAAPWIVKLIYGSRYSDAVPLMMILAFTLIWAIGIWMQPAFVSVGRARWGLEFQTIIVPAKIGLAVALVPSYGAVGLAIANLVYHAFICALAPWYFFRVKSVIRQTEPATS